MRGAPEDQLLVRVAALNLCAYPNKGWRPALASLLSDARPDVVLLQEVRRGWLSPIADATGLKLTHSHDVSPRVSPRPPDGVVIGARPDFLLERAWHLDPEAFEPANVRVRVEEPTPNGHAELPTRLANRYAVRTLFGEYSVLGRRIVFASLHATPGSSKAGVPGRRHQKVHEWKPFFHGATAIALSELALPFVFAIDANEPKSETLDAAAFHWVTGRPGVKKFEALLGSQPLHRGRDLLRDCVRNGLSRTETTDYLACTYTTGGGSPRRFDHLWATPGIDALRMETRYQAALDAGTDHALTVADLLVRAPISTPTSSASV